MGAPPDPIRRRTSDLAWAGGGVAGILLVGSAVEPDAASAFEVGAFRVFND
jgi:hypothetical protein